MGSEIDKINATSIGDIANIINVAKADIDTVLGVGIPASGLPSITDSNAVAKSITTGTGQAVYITDDNGAYAFDHDDPFTVSFWIKVGWNVSLNTHVHLFASADVSANSANKDSFRIWYYEPHNRLYAEWRHHQNHKRQNFWFFHSNSSSYDGDIAYAAAGLGTTYWNSSNRGNANSDGYTLITMTRGTTNSAASSNLKLYWNGTECGSGFYSSGSGAGTPAMSQLDKQITLGSQAWGSFLQSGNNDETKYNGVSIWDRVLTAAEVVEIYNNGVPGDLTGHSAASDLTGFWNFESDGSNEIAGGPAFTINGNSNIEAK